MDWRIWIFDCGKEDFGCFLKRLRNLYNLDFNNRILL